MRCARPGCGRPYPEHSPPGRTAPGCPGFLWVTPWVTPDHPRYPPDTDETPD